MLAGSILEQLKTAHQSGAEGKRPLNFGVYYKNTLVALCHALEDAILTAGASPLVIAAFQQGKWYLQEAERYGEIAQQASQIVILAAPETGFTEHATSQRENVALVSLDPQDPVAQEWHLMIVSPRYAAMVLCQELSADDYQAAGLPQTDLERKFYGLWTFEPRLVQEAVELAIAHIAPYNSALHTQLVAQLAAITATPPTPSREHLYTLTSQVIDYLQTTQQLPHPEILDLNLTSNELQSLLRLAQFIDQTDLSNPLAAAEVAALAEAMGQLLDLPAWQLHRLRLAGQLHRLAEPGSVWAAHDEIAIPDDPPTVYQCCPLNPGAQALRTMSRLRAIATIITHQTECWDGTGQPAGLAGAAIPLESRILGLVAHFQQHLTHRRSAPLSYHSSLPHDDSLASALAACQSQRGLRWDPQLVDTLTLLVQGLQQGIDLPVTIPKIASGAWLLDSHSQEQLL
jgi:DICT domain-containing protein